METNGNQIKNDHLLFFWSGLGKEKHKSFPLLLY